MPFDCIDAELKHAEVVDSVVTEPKQRKTDPEEYIGYWPDADRTDQEPIRSELR